MVIQQKSENIPVRSPLQLLDSRLLHLFPTEKSAPQTSFRPPIFFLSIRVPSPSLLCLSSRRSSQARSLVLFPFLLIFVLASQTQTAQENPLYFLLFPFLFQKSECSSPLMQDLLLPYVCSHINSFFLIKYFSYLLSAHTLVRVE